MGSHRTLRSLGFVMLGMIAAACLLSNLLSWWLIGQPMVVQPSGFSFVIDFYFAQQLAWGIVFIQPALLSVYLAYGKQQAIPRVFLTALVCVVVWAAQMIGWKLFNDRSNWVFIDSPELSEIALFFGAQTVSFSLAMWFSRIMRGWELSTNEISVESEGRPIRKQETVIESVALVALSVAAIYGPGVLFSQMDSVGASLFFAVIGLFGTVVFWPIVFATLRYRSFGLMCAALLILLIALPAILVGIAYGIDPGFQSPAEILRQMPIAAMLSASGMLCAFLFSLRLAGFRLQQRHFSKIEVTRVPVDPLAD